MTDSPPTKSPDAALPAPILPTPDPLAHLTKVQSLDPTATQTATADVTAPGPGTTQTRAETFDPKTGLPAQQIPTRTTNDKNPVGPNNLVPAKTDIPSPDGLPVKTPEVRGEKVGDPKPARSGDQKSAKPAKDKNKKEQLKPRQPIAKPMKANPTSAPRSEGDTPPTILELKPAKVQPGRVITRPGIEIITSIPNISVTSQLVSGPTARNPKARITFDKTGKVKRVVLLQSTAMSIWTAPLSMRFIVSKRGGRP